MKILNVIMSLDPINGGGTAERTFQISKFLAKAGVGCTVLTTNLGLTPERIKSLDGVDVIPLPCLFKRFYIPKFSYREIKHIVESVDIVHLMGHWALINALVYFVARRLKKPYVVCPAGELPIYGRSKFLKMFFNKIIGKKIILNAKKHIAISTNEIIQFQTYGVNLDKISVIPNGIDPEQFVRHDDQNFRSKFGLGAHPFILFVGRLNYIKGPDLLLKAFCNIKDVLQDYHLVFVGPDEGLLSSLKKIAAAYDIEDRVHFIGYLGGDNKSQAYYASELLVIPSRQEAMSIVVLEAGITGTPVLLTVQCGFMDIERSDGGLVVESSVNALQLGLIELLKNPAELKKRGGNLKKYINDHFSWEIIIDKYQKVYKEILNKYA